MQLDVKKTLEKAHEVTKEERAEVQDLHKKKQITKQVMGVSRSKLNLLDVVEAGDDAGAKSTTANPIHREDDDEVASSVAAVQQTTQMMSVTAPAGVSAGQLMMIQTPSGEMQVAVPAGVGPGMAFQVAVPAPAT